MLPDLPQAIPEIPVSDVTMAAAHYVEALGFHLDWYSEGDGIGGISCGACRLFLTSPSFRGSDAHRGKSVIWLNLESKAEVDALYERWRQAGARIAAAPEDKPWRLREFTALDLDGNHLRVFYDFTADLEAS